MTTFSAVVTTGIYCRPGCGARPRADNVRTFELAAAAEAAGFRACLRCRPYRIAGSVPWCASELVCRAVQLVLGGALDEGTEADLGNRLGISTRHLRRLFHDHLGLTPDQLARSRRAHFARRLLDDTDLGIADVAFASGFGSLRQFNRTMTEIFRLPPQRLRERRQRADRLTTDGGLMLRLPVTSPYDWEAMLAFLAAQAVPGVEAVEADGYRRTITLDGGPGLLEVGRGGPDHLLLTAHLPYWEGLIHVVERVGQLFAVEADPDGAGSDADPDGAGLDGAGLDGAGLIGAGSDGAGLDGAGLDGAGLDGAGSDGAGLDGAGPDGAGLDGAGPDGAGPDGAGLDGAGLDTVGGLADPVTDPPAGGGARLRMPGVWAPFEVAIQLAVRQHHGPEETRAQLGELVRAHGTPVPGLPHGLSHTFPGAEALAEADLEGSGLSADVASTVRAFAHAVAAGEIWLDGGVEAEAFIDSVTSIPGYELAAAKALAVRLGVSGSGRTGGVRVT